MKSSSFFTEHPWMTLILGLAVVNGAVIMARGYDHPRPLIAPHVAPSLAPARGVAPAVAPKVSGDRGYYR
jgi:hypothetical protein